MYAHSYGYNEEDSPPPPRVDPLPTWLGWAAAVGRKKVASNRLKIGQQVAHG